MIPYYPSLYIIIRYNMSKSRDIFDPKTAASSPQSRTPYRPETTMQLIHVTAGNTLGRPVLRTTSQKEESSESILIC